MMMECDKWFGKMMLRFVAMYRVDGRQMWAQWGLGGYSEKKKLEYLVDERVLDLCV
jgi:hypothetical protein